jgi:predicted signal transduction protein with EAL and GGDEF domain
LPVTVSAGVTTAMDGDSLHSLIARADSALYSAKASGGGCVYCHTGRQIEAAEQHSLQDATRSSTRREFAESGTAV